MEQLSAKELGEVVDGIAGVVSGRQGKLFVSSLSQNITAAQANTMLDELWNMLKHARPSDTIIQTRLTLRDLLKAAFAGMGIEIEFSGRDQYEKAVIIDADLGLAAQLRLATHLLMPGRTVARVRLINVR